MIFIFSLAKRQANKPWEPLQAHLFWLKLHWWGGYLDGASLYLPRPLATVDLRESCGMWGSEGCWDTKPVTAGLSHSARLYLSKSSAWFFVQPNFLFSTGKKKFNLTHELRHECICTHASSLESSSILKPDSHGTWTPMLTGNASAFGNPLSVVRWSWISYYHVFLITVSSQNWKDRKIFKLFTTHPFWEKIKKLSVLLRGSFT